VRTFFSNHSSLCYTYPISPEYNQNFAGIEYEDLVPPDKDEQAIDFLIAIIVVVICVIVISFLIMIAVRYITRRRHNRWLRELNHAQMQVLSEEEQYETKRQKDLNKRMKPLILSKEVPLIFKIGIPITIFGNIALFLSGHLSLGGTVNISGSFAGQDFNIEGFFEFSMVKVSLFSRFAHFIAYIIAHYELFCFLRVPSTCGRQGLKSWLSRLQSSVGFGLIQNNWYLS
jgi:type II secretory pathway pseudopilin PulG